MLDIVRVASLEVGCDELAIAILAAIILLALAMSVFLNLL
jgi:hypothetical protein